MSEYIKREDVYKTLNLVLYVDGCEPSVTEIDMDAFESIPAADVEPVVRARWQDGKCTNCDCFGFPRPDGSNEYTIRCPNCGAHMMERSGSGE